MHRSNYQKYQGHQTIVEAGMTDSTNVPQLQKAAGAFSMNGIHYSSPATHMLVSVYARRVRISHALARNLRCLRDNQAAFRLDVKSSVLLCMKSRYKIVGLNVHTFGSTLAVVLRVKFPRTLAVIAFCAQSRERGHCHTMTHRRCPDLPWLEQGHDFIIITVKFYHNPAGGKMKNVELARQT